MVNNEYFEINNERQSLFDRYCNQILLTAFGMIKNTKKRKNDLHVFSVGNRKVLKKHILASCKECALAHIDLQQVFPGVKYQPTQSLMWS